MAEEVDQHPSSSEMTDSLKKNTDARLRACLDVLMTGPTQPVRPDSFDRYQSGWSWFAREYTSMVMGGNPIVLGPYRWDDLGDYLRVCFAAAGLHVHGLMKGRFGFSMRLMRAVFQLEEDAVLVIMRARSDE